MILLRAWYWHVWVMRERASFWHASWHEKPFLICVTTWRREKMCAWLRGNGESVKFPWLHKNVIKRHKNAWLQRENGKWKKVRDCVIRHPHGRGAQRREKEDFTVLSAFSSLHVWVQSSWFHLGIDFIYPSLTTWHPKCRLLCRWSITRLENIQNWRE